MKIQHKIYIKSIAALLVGTFFFQELSHASYIVEAAPPALDPQTKLLRDPFSFQSPLENVTLDEIHSADNASAPLFIHIQDAHANLSGQENLSAALDQIISRYHVNLVLVEGGTRDDTLTPIKNVGTAEAWKKVAKKYLMASLISGDEYLNLTSDHPMKIMGIEDKALYQQSLMAYAGLREPREKNLEYLKNIQNVVEKLKRRIYPKELLDYETHKQSSVAVLLQRIQINPGEYPNLQKMAALLKKEMRIDFQQANLEQMALLEEIGKRGGHSELKKTLEEIAKSKNQRLAQRTVFQNITALAAKQNIPLSNYPNLVRYGEYLDEFSHLDMQAVIEEQESAEEWLYVSKLASEDSKLLRSIDRYLKLLVSAYRIQMTTKEFASFEANEKDFLTLSCLAFLNRKLAESGYAADLVTYDECLEQGKTALRAFYESVSLRDLAFLQNAKKAMARRKEKAAILITGGYHTPHLKKLLRENGSSYIVLSPIVSSETNQAKYEKILLSTLKHSDGERQDSYNTTGKKSDTLSIMKAFERRGTASVIRNDVMRSLGIQRSTRGALLAANGGGLPYVLIAQEKLKELKDNFLAGAYLAGKEIPQERERYLKGAWYKEFQTRLNGLSVGLTPKETLDFIYRAVFESLASDPAYHWPFVCRVASLAAIVGLEYANQFLPPTAQMQGALLMHEPYRDSPNYYRHFFVRVTGPFPALILDLTVSQFNYPGYRLDLDRNFFSGSRLSARPLKTFWTDRGDAVRSVSFRKAIADDSEELSFYLRASSAVLMDAGYKNENGAEHRFLTPEEERAEYEKYKSGDVQATNILLASQAWRIAKIVYQFSYRARSLGISLMELYEIAENNLRNALKTFDPLRTRLASYSELGMRRELNRHLKLTADQPQKYFLDSNVAVSMPNKEGESLIETRDRTADLLTIISKLPPDSQRVAKQIFGSSESPAFRSAQMPLEETVINRIKKIAALPSRFLDLSVTWSRAISVDWTNNYFLIEEEKKHVDFATILLPREMQLLALRYPGGSEAPKSFPELQETFPDITRSRIKQIEEAAINKIKAHKILRTIRDENGLVSKEYLDKLSEESIDVARRVRNKLKELEKSGAWDGWSPIFVDKDKQKNRALEIIRIMEAQGDATSLKEVGKALGMDREKYKLLEMFRGVDNLETFFERLNHNRKLLGRTFLEAGDPRVIENRRYMIEELEKKDGIASAEELRAAFGHADTSWIYKLFKAVPFETVNYNRRLKKQFPLYTRLIDPNQKEIQNEIIAIVEKSGGVQTLRGIAAARGVSVDTAKQQVAAIDWDYVNEVRRSKGLFQLEVSLARKTSPRLAKPAPTLSDLQPVIQALEQLNGMASVEELSTLLPMPDKLKTNTQKQSRAYALFHKLLPHMDEVNRQRAEMGQFPLYPKPVMGTRKRVWNRILKHLEERAGVSTVQEIAVDTDRTVMSVYEALREIDWDYVNRVRTAKGLYPLRVFYNREPKSDKGPRSDKTLRLTADQLPSFSDDMRHYLLQVYREYMGSKGYDGYRSYRLIFLPYLYDRYLEIFKPEGQKDEREAGELFIKDLLTLVLSKAPQNTRSTEESQNGIPRAELINYYFQVQAVRAVNLGLPEIKARDIKGFGEKLDRVLSEDYPLAVSSGYGVSGSRLAAKKNKAVDPWLAEARRYVKQVAEFYDGFDRHGTRRVGRMYATMSDVASKEGFRKMLAHFISSKAMKYLGIPKTTRLLSLGAGQGHLEKALMDLKLNVLGVDVSPVNVEIAESRGVPMIEKNIYELGKLDYPHDVVLFNECEGHLDMDRALDVALENLSKNGLLMVTSYTDISPEEKNALSENFIAYQTRTPSEMTQIFKRHGLEVVEKSEWKIRDFNKPYTYYILVARRSEGSRLTPVKAIWKSFVHKTFLKRIIGMPAYTKAEAAWLINSDLFWLGDRKTFRKYFIYGVTRGLHSHIQRRDFNIEDAAKLLSQSIRNWVENQYGIELDGPLYDHLDVSPIHIAVMAGSSQAGSFVDQQNVFHERLFLFKVPVLSSSRYESGSVYSELIPVTKESADGITERLANYLQYHAGSRLAAEWLDEEATSKLFWQVAAARKHYEEKDVTRDAPLEINGEKINVWRTNDERVYRVGPLVFMVLPRSPTSQPEDSLRLPILPMFQQSLVRSGVTKTNNVLFIDPSKATSTPLNGYSISVIAAMLARREEFRDAYVLDAGAETGLLSHVALLLGAKKVYLADSSGLSLAVARSLLKNQGWSEASFALREGDLLDKAFLQKIIKEAPEGQRWISLANLGPWYGKTNRVLLSRLAHSGRIGLIINSGYFLSKNSGFTPNHPNYFRGVIRLLERRGMAVTGDKTSVLNGTYGLITAVSPVTSGARLARREEPEIVRNGSQRRQAAQGIDATYMNEPHYAARNLATYEAYLGLRFKQDLTRLKNELAAGRRKKILILDMGSGSGRPLHEMLEELGPASVVQGIGLSIIKFPLFHNKSPNESYVIADVFGGLPLKDSSLTLGASVVGPVPRNKSELFTIMNEICRVLEPGGVFYYQVDDGAKQLFLKNRAALFPIFKSHGVFFNIESGRYEGVLKQVIRFEKNSYGSRLAESPNDDTGFILSEDPYSELTAVLEDDAPAAELYKKLSKNIYLQILFRREEDLHLKLIESFIVFSHERNKNSAENIGTAYVNFIKADPDRFADMNQIYSKIRSEWGTPAAIDLFRSKTQITLDGLAEQLPQRDRWRQEYLNHFLASKSGLTVEELGSLGLLDLVLILKTAQDTTKSSGRRPDLNMMFDLKKAYNAVTERSMMFALAKYLGKNPSFSGFVEACLPSLAKAGSRLAQKLDPNKIFNDDPDFLRAVKYFNDEIIGNVQNVSEIKPVTWEKIVNLYEIYRGDDRNPKYRAAPEEREKRLSHANKENVLWLLQLVNEVFDPADSEAIYQRISALHSNITQDSDPWGDQFLGGLEGFEKIRAISRDDYGNSYPRNGHHRLWWFLANFLMIRSGRAPFYFKSEEEYDSTIPSENSWYPENQNLERILQDRIFGARLAKRNGNKKNGDEEEKATQFLNVKPHFPGKEELLEQLTAAKAGEYWVMMHVQLPPGSAQPDMSLSAYVLDFEFDEKQGLFTIHYINEAQTAKDIQVHQGELSGYNKVLSFTFNPSQKIPASWRETGTTLFDRLPDQNIRTNDELLKKAAKLWGTRVVIVYEKDKTRSYVVGTLVDYLRYETDGRAVIYLRREKNSKRERFYFSQRIDAKNSPKVLYIDTATPAQIKAVSAPDSGSRLAFRHWPNLTDAEEEAVHAFWKTLDTADVNSKEALRLAEMGFDVRIGNYPELYFAHDRLLASEKYRGRIPVGAQWFDIDSAMSHAFQNISQHSGKKSEEKGAFLARILNAGDGKGLYQIIILDRGAGFINIDSGESVPIPLAVKQGVPGQSLGGKDTGFYGIGFTAFARKATNLRVTEFHQSKSGSSEGTRWIKQNASQEIGNDEKMGEVIVPNGTELVWEYRFDTAGSRLAAKTDVSAEWRFLDTDLNFGYMKKAPGGTYILSSKKDREPRLPVKAHSGNIFMLDTGQAMMADLGALPGLKIATKNLADCTGVCIRAVKEGRVYLGLAHIFESWAGSTQTLQDEIAYLRDQLVEEGFDPGSMQYIVDYQKGMFAGDPNENEAAIRKKFPRTQFRMRDRDGGEFGDDLFVDERGVFIRSDYRGEERPFEMTWASETGARLAGRDIAAFIRSEREKIKIPDESEDSKKVPAKVRAMKVAAHGFTDNEGLLRMLSSMLDGSIRSLPVSEIKARGFEPNIAEGDDHSVWYSDFDPTMGYGPDYAILKYDPPRFKDNVDDPGWAYDAAITGVEISKIPNEDVKIYLVTTAEKKIYLRAALRRAARQKIITAQKARVLSRKIYSMNDLEKMSGSRLAAGMDRRQFLTAAGGAAATLLTAQISDAQQKPEPAPKLNIVDRALGVSIQIEQNGTLHINREINPNEWFDYIPGKGTIRIHTLGASVDPKTRQIKSTHDTVVFILSPSNPDPGDIERYFNALNTIQSLIGKLLNDKKDLNANDKKQLEIVNVMLTQQIKNVGLFADVYIAFAVLMRSPVGKKVSADAFVDVYTAKLKLLSDKAADPKASPEDRKADQYAFGRVFEKRQDFLLRLYLEKKWFELSAQKNTLWIKSVAEVSRTRKVLNRNELWAAPAWRNLVTMDELQRRYAASPPESAWEVLDELSIIYGRMRKFFETHEARMPLNERLIFYDEAAYDIALMLMMAENIFSSNKIPEEQFWAKTESALKRSMEQEGRLVSLRPEDMMRFRSLRDYIEFRGLIERIQAYITPLDMTLPQQVINVKEAILKNADERKKALDKMTEMIANYLVQKIPSLDKHFTLGDVKAFLAEQLVKEYPSAVPLYGYYTAVIRSGTRNELMSIANEVSRVERELIDKWAPKEVAATIGARRAFWEELQKMQAEPGSRLANRDTQETLVGEYFKAQSGSGSSNAALSAAINDSSRIPYELTANDIPDVGRYSIKRLLTITMANALDAINTRMRREPGFHEGKVRISYYVNDGGLHIALVDNGIGYPDTTSSFEKTDENGYFGRNKIDVENARAYFNRIQGMLVHMRREDGEVGSMTHIFIPKGHFSSGSRLAVKRGGPVQGSGAKSLPAEEESSHVTIFGHMLDYASEKNLIPAIQKNEPDIFLKFFKGRKVLNIGLETSRSGFPVAHNILSELRSRGIEAYALDPQDTNIEGHIKGVVQKMPVEDDSFDDEVSIGLFDPFYVYSMFGTNKEISQFYAAAASEIRRTLKNGGVFYLNAYGENDEFAHALLRAGFRIVVLEKSLNHYAFINRKTGSRLSTGSDSANFKQIAVISVKRPVPFLLKHDDVLRYLVEDEKAYSGLSGIEQKSLVEYWYSVLNQLALERHAYLKKNDQANAKKLKLLIDKVNIFTQKAEDALEISLNEERGDWTDIPLDANGLVDLKKVLVPNKVPQGGELMQEIRQYIWKYVKSSDEKLFYAIQNLNNPKLLPYMEEARKYNVLLVVSREIKDEELKTKFEPYFKDLLLIFKAVPPEMFWELSGPIGWEVAKTSERTYGFQGKADTWVGGGAGMTIMKGIDPQLDHGSVMDEHGLYNLAQLRSTVIHELLGHKRSFTKRRKFEMADGKIREVKGAFTPIMDRDSWIAIGRRNGLQRLLPLTDDLRLAVEHSLTIAGIESLDLDQLPEDPQKLLQLMRNLYILPYGYYNDILELVAFSTEDDDLTRPDKEGNERNKDHDLNGTREILAVSNARVGLPVDPKEDVYISHSYHQIGRDFSAQYFRRKLDKDKTEWQEVKFDEKTKTWRPASAAVLKLPEAGAVPVPGGDMRSLKSHERSLRLGNAVTLKILPINRRSIVFTVEDDSMMVIKTVQGKDRISIGRGNWNDVEIPVGTVSGEHLHVLFDKQANDWRIQDFNSTNGTRDMAGNRVDDVLLSELPSGSRHAETDEKEAFLEKIAKAPDADSLQFEDIRRLFLEFKDRIQILPIKKSGFSAHRLEIPGKSAAFEFIFYEHVTSDNYVLFINKVDENGKTIGSDKLFDSRSKKEEIDQINRWINELMNYQQDVSHVNISALPKLPVKPAQDGSRLAAQHKSLWHMEYLKFMGKQKRKEVLGELKALARQFSEEDGITPLTDERVARIMQNEDENKYPLSQVYYDQSGKMAAYVLAVQDLENEKVVGEHMGIRKDIRNTRLSVQIAKTVLEQAKKAGARSFELAVLPENVKAQKLYQKAGFKPVARLIDKTSGKLKGYLYRANVQQALDSINSRYFSRKGSRLAGKTVNREPWMADQTFLNVLLNPKLSPLDNRERQILIGRFGLNEQTKKTLDQLAAEFKINKNRVRQVEWHALLTAESFYLTKAWEQLSLSDESIILLNLNADINKKLLREGIYTIGQLSSLSVEALEGIRDIKSVRIQKIQKALQLRGLSLRTAESGIKFTETYGARLSQQRLERANVNLVDTSTKSLLAKWLLSGGKASELSPIPIYVTLGNEELFIGLIRGGKFKRNSAEQKIEGEVQFDLMDGEPVTLPISDEDFKNASLVVEREVESQIAESVVTELAGLTMKGLSFHRQFFKVQASGVEPLVVAIPESRVEVQDAILKFYEMVKPALMRDVHVVFTQSEVFKDGKLDVVRGILPQEYNRIVVMADPTEALRNAIRGKAGLVAMPPVQYVNGQLKMGPYAIALLLSDMMASFDEKDGAAKAWQNDFVRQMLGLGLGSRYDELTEQEKPLLAATLIRLTDDSGNAFYQKITFELLRPFNLSQVVAAARLAVQAVGSAA